LFVLTAHHRAETELAALERTGAQRAAALRHNLEQLQDFQVCTPQHSAVPHLETCPGKFSSAGAQPPPVGQAKAVAGEEELQQLGEEARGRSRLVEEAEQELALAEAELQQQLSGHVEHSSCMSDRVQLLAELEFYTQHNAHIDESIRGVLDIVTEHSDEWLRKIEELSEFLEEHGDYGASLSPFLLDVMHQPNDP
jgi:hypothetical protein